MQGCPCFADVLPLLQVSALLALWFSSFVLHETHLLMAVSVCRLSTFP